MAVPLLQVLWHMLVSLSEKLLQVHFDESLVFVMSEVTLVQPFRNVDIGLLEDLLHVKWHLWGMNTCALKGQEPCRLEWCPEQPGS